MNKFLYYVEDVIPDKLDNVLTACGENGWELATLVVMQQQTQNKLSIGGAAPQYMIETKFKLIFKKPQIPKT